MNEDNNVAEYNVFRDFLAEACGIFLGDNKQYLVDSRLNKLMKNNQIESLTGLVAKAKQASNRSLRDAVVDAMTTNETLWFRDAYPFNIFKDMLLPELQEKIGSIRIWSAACSSGQEPYSLSMITEEYLKKNVAAVNSRIDILATELSKTMLDTCKLAEYDSLSLGRGLSPERRKQFFEATEGSKMRVKSEVTQRVRFQQLNLMDSFAALGKFDVVFCRNVLIYFSTELKIDILQRIHSTLRPGGYLVLGSSEGLNGIEAKYELVQCQPGIIYRAL